MSPVGLADKQALLRRVTYDLIGLPPTRDEIKSFLSDESPIAFATVVNRLLDSPHYGERWGRHWLDVARYADTAGNGSDHPIPEAYRYRNYVIRSMNADKPFDEFVREQIAGDLIAQQSLEGTTQTAEQYSDRITATGFLAIGKRFGYNDNNEFVHLDIADVIDSVGRSVLGVSLGCARCHDHKFDPISANDYYALYGIFASSRFAFPGGEELQKQMHFVPCVLPKEAERKEQWRTNEVGVLDHKIAELELEQSSLERTMIGGGADYGLEHQQIGQAPQAPWIHQGPNLILAEAQSPFSQIHPIGTRGVRVSNTNPYEGVRREFLQHTAATSPQLYFNIDFRNVNQVDGEPAYRFYLGHGAIVSLAFEASVSSDEIVLRNGPNWESLAPLEVEAWYHLSVTFDLQNQLYSGSLLKSGTTTPIRFADKRMAPNWDGIVNCFVSDGFGKTPGTPPTRDLDNLCIQNAPLSDPMDAGILEKQAARLKWVQATLSETKQQRDELLHRRLYEVAYGVSEGQPTNVRLQKRGEPDRLGDEVPRRNLTVLGGQPVPADGGSGRLQLAEWLTDPANPLTARVIVNRVWQWHFGEGLVRSPSDFGNRGDLPSHPELLDDLAASFVRDRWSLKSLHKQILASRTYQLASNEDATNLQHDAENRWLWRFPRRTLDAESIRDSMLTFGDQLNRHMPDGHPFPDANSWNFSIHYPFKGNYDSNDRSVYLMVARSQKHPFLSLFDGSDPNVSTASRFTTTTPIQALYLMNSPFVSAQSKAFAKRILETPGDEQDQIQFAVETVIGRQPSDSAIETYQLYLARYREQFAKLNLSEDLPTELAWASLARVLMTSNEFLFVE